MNRRQLLVQKQFLNNEKAVIERLQYIYDKALFDIDEKIRNLEFTIGDLQEQYDWMDPDDPKREIIKSMIQSKIYQKDYQQVIQKQVDGILKRMQTDQYLTVSDYLETCYEDGFVGSLFDLHGQNVPMVMPIDQQAMVRAIQLDSKISEGLYTRMGVDAGVLKKRITSEVTRSIASGVSWEQVAQRLAGQTRIGYNKAVRIVRTEGHRIQTTATMDVMQNAKNMGADVVKQWDATLDGKTRPSHQKVDGEIRELDESFSNGLDFPGDPDGAAGEVINCRCALLQRARWALDDGFTKMDNFSKQLETFDSPQKYDEFKTGFFSDGNVKYMNYVEQMQDKYSTRDMAKILSLMTTREYNHYSRLLANNPVYNAKPKPVFTPATVDDFPAMFRTRSGKKPVQTFVDALNEAEYLDPNIRKLYTSMDDLPFMPANSTITYTGTNHELRRWTRYGETTRCNLNVPKMVGDDLMGQKSTAFHEMAHLIDMGCGDKKQLLSELRPDLSDVVKASGMDMGDEVEELLNDFGVQFVTMRNDLRTTYGARRSALTAEYRAGNLFYSDYSKQWDALVREENAQRDYQARNLCGGGVTGLSDIYDALSGGFYRDNDVLYFGHGGKYYSDPGNQNCEIFANYMSLSVNRPDLVEMLRKDKPELCKALDELIEEMAGAIK